LSFRTRQKVHNIWHALISLFFWPSPALLILPAV
jgi:hypothetical protein